ncbi:MAG: deoxyribose-phosphate aldolase [Sphingobacteriales bacterium]|jgi:deoxyribose-phosphate aldolase|nr:deoxyribose-phosphate aldolase [Sphingobacteriales bacterium]
MTLANFIEHTNLKPNATAEDIIALCNEAIENGFYGICVSPYYIQLAKKTIKKAPVKIISVIGFPFGYNTVSSKVEEAKKAINSGADEVDMVINLAAFKSGDMATVQNDIQAVVTACHLQNKLVKVIIETCFLNEEEIKLICKICADCEADFVKTSTGYGVEGATVDVVKIMRKCLPAKIKIKASGGIKTKSFAEDLIAAGANRIGTSAGVDIIQA